MVGFSGTIRVTVVSFSYLGPAEIWYWKRAKHMNLNRYQMVFLIDWYFSWMINLMESDGQSELRLAWRVMVLILEIWYFVISNFHIWQIRGCGVEDLSKRKATWSFLVIGSTPPILIGCFSFLTYHVDRYDPRITHQHLLPIAICHFSEAVERLYLFPVTSNLFVALFVFTWRIIATVPQIWQHVYM